MLSIGLGGACGYGLDVLLDTAPWLLVLGCLLGGAGGMYTIYRRAIGQ
ncbi:MAG: AtpZ/AtpI family protein [Veillonella sp.]|nr:AtpZ/AtpI family protein [Veillonella sp.]